VKIVINDKLVKLDDESGCVITMSTEQLVEIAKLVTVSLGHDGIFAFDMLEFRV